MIRGRGQQQYDDIESEEDLGSEFSGDELVTQDPIEEMEAENIDAGLEHVKKENYKGAQWVMMDIEVLASPEELQAGHVSTTWKLAPHLPKHLKQNMAAKNRDNAADHELAGNLGRCVPLQLEIVQQKNSMPFAMAIRAPGMLAKTFDRHNNYLWRVPPDTATMKVNELIFEPTNPITKNMYLNSTMYTLEELEDDIKVFEKTAKREAYGTVAVKSLAYAHLMDNLDLGKWKEETEHLDLDAIYSAPERHTRAVEVTPKIATQLKTILAKPTNEVLERCLNLEDFNVELVRADGQTEYNSAANLHGELVGSEVDADGKIRADKLLQRGIFHVKAKFHYFLL